MAAPYPMAAQYLVVLEYPVVLGYPVVFSKSNGLTVDQIASLFIQWFHCLSNGSRSYQWYQGLSNSFKVNPIVSRSIRWFRNPMLSQSFKWLLEL